MNINIEKDSNKELFVTVVVPCYNHEKYLVECLQSIFSQNYKNFEVIIRDDGSTDKSVGVINSFLSNPSNTSDISYSFESGKNIGLIKSLNYILKKAKGEIILFCASDDIFLQNRINKAVEIHLKYPIIELVACNAIVIDDYGGIIRSSFYNVVSYDKEIEEYYSGDYKRDVGIALGGFGISFKKSLLKPSNYQFPDSLAYEDGYLSFLALMNGGAIRLNTPFMKYRRSVNSISRGNTSTDLNEILKNEMKFLKMFLNLEEHKLKYIIGNSYVNNNIFSNKKHIINFLKQKILCLNLKISMVENKSRLNLWFNLFCLIFIGVKSAYTLNILLKSIFNRSLLNLLVEDNNNRNKIL